MSKHKRAVVYLWPLLSADDAEIVEDQCVAAGYETKRKVTLKGYIFWEIS